MVIVTVRLLLLAQLNISSSINDIVLSLTVLGIGFGLFSSPNTRAAMSSVERSKLGVASGSLGTMRAAGQPIGLAMAGAAIATALPAQIILALFTGLTVQSDMARGGFVIGMSQLLLIGSAI
jgi:hypothetical protein